MSLLLATFPYKTAVIRTLRTQSWIHSLCVFYLKGGELSDKNDIVSLFKLVYHLSFPDH